MAPEHFDGLMEDLQAGVSEAANQVVDQYTQALVTVARRRIGTKLSRRVDPEDIIQSTYRSFFMRVQNGEFVVGTVKDLWRLLVTIMLNKLRSQARHHTAGRRSIDLERSAGSPTGPHPAELRPCREPGPEEAVALVEQVQAFLGALSPRDREIAELKLQGYSNAEVAEKIGRTERSVRRVLQYLREHLEQEAFC